MNDERGFSIIELLIVIAIIAILAGLAIPTFQELRARSVVIEAGQQVARDIERVRLEGRRRNSETSLSISNGATTYDLVLGDGAAREVSLPQGTRFEVMASPILLAFAPPYGVIDPGPGGVHELSVAWTGPGRANQQIIAVVGPMAKVIVR